MDVPLQGCVCEGLPNQVAKLEKENRELRKLQKENRELRAFKDSVTRLVQV